jgi:hypothetical protein
VAAPAFGSLGTLLGASGATPAFAVPASVAADDIIVVAAFLDGAVSVTAMPSGFAHAAGSPLAVASGGGFGEHSLVVMWKRATAGDTGTYDFTLSGSAFVYGNAVRYTGAITTGDPWDATDADQSGAVSVSTAPAVDVTTLGADRLLVYAATDHNGDAGTWTPPTGFTQRQGGTNTTNTEISDLVQVGAGSSGSVSATHSVAGFMGAWLGALIGTTAAAGTIPPPAARTVQGRDPGEQWWLQRDRRNANTVAAAANPLPAPLDVAYGVGGTLWHQRGGAADAAARTWTTQQRTYTDPTLLTPPPAMPSPPGPRTVPGRDYGEAQWLQRAARTQVTTALLENVLLGGAGTAGRASTPATNAARWWMPQQPPRRAFTPGLLDSAELEGPLLAGDLRRHGHAAVYTDRREMPQQRSYISDPSVYPTVDPTDPLTVAHGAGGAYWLLYNGAALRVDRRRVPQQRRYLSDPGLLATALLEGVLLTGPRRVAVAAYTDRRATALPRPAPDPSLLVDEDVDPTTLAAGVGGDLWRRTNTPAYGARQRTVAQPARQTWYFDAGPDVPPLTLAWGVGGNLWHVYNPRRDNGAWWRPSPVYALPADHLCITPRPNTGTTTHVVVLTVRPDTGITEAPC